MQNRRKNFFFPRFHMDRNLYAMESLKGVFWCPNFALPGERTSHIWHVPVSDGQKNDICQSCMHSFLVLIVHASQSKFLPVEKTFDHFLVWYISHWHKKCPKTNDPSSSAHSPVVLVFCTRPILVCASIVNTKQKMYQTEHFSFLKIYHGLQEN